MSLHHICINFACDKQKTVYQDDADMLS